VLRVANLGNCHTRRVENQPIISTGCAQMEAKTSRTTSASSCRNPCKSRSFVDRKFTPPQRRKKHCAFEDKAFLGAKVLLETNGVKSKHAVINTQARPGQSGSLVFSPKDQSISGVLVGAWVPGPGGISLGGINPRELHQTTQCVSAEYLRDML